MTKNTCSQPVSRGVGTRVFTFASCAVPTVVAMTTHTIDTKFGRADVRVHRLADGWRAVLVGRHLVPYPPLLSGPRATSEAQAVAQLLAAVQAVDLALQDHT